MNRAPKAQGPEVQREYQSFRLRTLFSPMLKHMATQGSFSLIRSENSTLLFIHSKLLWCHLHKAWLTFLVYHSLGRAVEAAMRSGLEGGQKSLQETELKGPWGKCTPSKVGLHSVFRGLEPRGLEIQPVRSRNKLVSTRGTMCILILSACLSPNKDGPFLEADTGPKHLCPQTLLQGRWKQQRVVGGCLTDTLVDHTGLQFCLKMLH